MKIRNEILDVLGNCRVDGNTLFLPKLERNLYTEVNKCIENIGGKWNRKAGGHVFESDPTDLLDNIIITGETIDLKKELQFFPTPLPIVSEMLQQADIRAIPVAQRRILEPSAGTGVIVKFLLSECNFSSLVCVEINPDMVDKLNEMVEMFHENYLDNMTVVESDFLNYNPTELFSHIIMNPPFSRQQDIKHVLHAYELLKEGGTLVSIASEGPFYRSDKKSVEFRDFLDSTGAKITDLAAGAFKESGTMVKTRMIKIIK